ncbi:Protein Star [Armadillidium vulgare]|nr:Protein Star [Armadillidium vulgare]
MSGERLFFVCNFNIEDNLPERNTNYLRIIYRAEGPLKANDSSILTLIRNEYLNPPSSSKYTFTKHPFYKKHSKSLSWSFIHKHLKNLFENEKRRGFFVEAGALDGEFLSNTLWLEKYKGWKGLLIEPDTANFRSLLKKNRKAWTDLKSKLLYGLWAARGLSYDIKNGFYYEDTSNYHQVYSSIQTFPLESLLLALNVTVVDFLSLDTQGGEFDILKHFPFGRIKVRTMVVEYYADDTPGKFSSAFVDFVERKGFVFVDSSFEPDYFFINKDETKLLRNVKATFDKKL